MAMITCPECGKEISDQSEKCIHCGYPLKKPDNKKKIPWIPILIVVAILCICGVGLLATKMLGSSSVANVCKQDGCNNPVYSNGYCIDHYKTETTTASKSAADSNSIEIETLSFTKDVKIETESCEFTFEGYSIKDKVMPTNFKGTYYHYYEASKGNTFVDNQFTIKNLGTKDVEQSKIFSSVVLIYDDDYEYRCQFITVDKDGDFEGYTNLYSISPLETMKYHILAEVPEEVKDSDKPLLLRIMVDDKYYECKLRK